MQFQVWHEQKLFQISLLEIKFNAKFKCELDIFIKFGSQREELFKGVSIQYTKSDSQILKIAPSIKQIHPTKKNNQSKNHRNILQFELRSKNYNAFAGQVEIQYPKTQKVVIQQKIENCVDQNAKIVYEIVHISSAFKQSSVLNKQRIFQNQQQTNITNNKLQRQQTTHKKNNVSQENVEVAQFVRQLKNSRSAQYVGIKNISDLSKIGILKNQLTPVFSPQSKRKAILELQGNSQFQNLTAEKQNQQNYIRKNILESIKETKFRSTSLEKSENVFELQRRVDQEKERNLRLQSQLNSKKCQLTQLENDKRKIEKKLQSLQTELKTTKKNQSLSTRQNLKLKEQVSDLKQKINQKTQHFNIITERNLVLQKTYKQELRKISEKLDTSCRQKQLEKQLKIGLQQQLETLQRRHNHDIGQKDAIHDEQRHKLQKMIKKLQTEIETTSKSFTSSIQMFGAQIQRLFKNKLNYKINGEESNLYDLTYKKSFKTTQYFDASYQTWPNLKEILSKVERMSSEFYFNIHQKSQQIDQQQTEIKSLKKQLKQAYATQQTFKEETAKQKKKLKDDIQKLQQQIQLKRKETEKTVKNLQQKINQLEEKKAEAEKNIKILQQKINELEEKKVQADKSIKNLQQKISELEQKKIQAEKNIKNLQQNISELEEKKIQFQKTIKKLQQKVNELQVKMVQLNDIIKAKNQQVSSLKTAKQQLQQKISRMTEQYLKKEQKFEASIRNLIKQKQEITNNYKAQVSRLQDNLKKQTIKSTQLTEKNVSLSTKISSLEKEAISMNEKIANQQKQLKAEQQTNQLMTRESNQVKNIINDMTVLAVKKQDHKVYESKELLSQVTRFKQIYKSVLQQKALIQQQLFRTQAEIKSLGAQNIQKLQEYSKIEQIISIDQKPLGSLQNYVMDIRKQNEDLKTKIKKKEEFQEELEDEFQCNFYQIREKLEFFMKENSELDKLKTSFERELGLKTKKLTTTIESQTQELKYISEFLAYQKNENSKVKIVFSEIRGLIDNVQKQFPNAETIFTQLNQKLFTADKMVSQVLVKHGQLQESLVQARQNRDKRNSGLRSTSASDRSLTRKSSIADFSTSNLPSSMRRAPSLSTSSLETSSKFKRESNYGSRVPQLNVNAFQRIDEVTEADTNMNQDGPDFNQFTQNTNQSTLYPKANGSKPGRQSFLRFNQKSKIQSKDQSISGSRETPKRGIKRTNTFK